MDLVSTVIEPIAAMLPGVSESLSPASAVILLSKDLWRSRVLCRERSLEQPPPAGSAAAPLDRPARRRLHPSAWLGSAV